MKLLGNWLIIGFVAAGLQSQSVSASPWPERIVRILVPSAAGSSVDLAARVFAEGLAQRWERPVVVENRAGADGILAVQSLLQAGDGHTLLLAFPGIVTVVPLLHERVPYDPIKDIVPISSVAYDFLAITAAATLSVGSLDALVATARARPGQLNWAAPPGAPYLTFLAFQRRTGIQLTYVPFRSSSLAMPDLIRGEIHVAVTPLLSALPLARDGKLNLLAVSTLRRSLAVPDIPTATEAGHPELTVEAPLGLFGPKGMSLELRTRIASDVAAIATEPAILKRLEEAGMLAQATTPEEYADVLAEQRTHWASLVRLYGAHPR